jgi:predicted ester cyclase
MGQAREVVERWWSFFEAGCLDETAQVCHPDVEVMLPGGMRLHGPAEVSATLGAFRDGFPDIRHEILDAVEAGEKIAVELKVTGTHTGVFRTPQGDVPPTGRSVVWESVDVITLRDGLIVSWHTYFDQMAFLAQLGVLPEPVTAAA